MKLQQYLDRIGFEGVPGVDAATLKQIHRKHLLAISYENLDVQIGRPLDLDIRRIYDKLVTQRRGGWCYEMNGLLAWALSEVGFDVMRVCGGVMRVERGDAAFGNHLVLLVELGGTWLVDVGFGDGLIEPVPLQAGDIIQRGFHYRLEQLDDGYWRFHNHPWGGAGSFDFRPVAADEHQLAEQCRHLQTSPESPFLLNLVCQRAVADGFDVQVGRIAKRITPDGVTTQLIESRDAFVARLANDFDLDLPEATGLWPRVYARHEAIFGST